MPMAEDASKGMIDFAFGGHRSSDLLTITEDIEQEVSSDACSEFAVRLLEDRRFNAKQSVGDSIGQTFSMVAGREIGIGQRCSAFNFAARTSRLSEDDYGPGNSISIASAAWNERIVMSNSVASFKREKKSDHAWDWPNWHCCWLTRMFYKGSPHRPIEV